MYFQATSKNRPYDLELHIDPLTRLSFILHYTFCYTTSPLIFPVFLKYGNAPTKKTP